MKTLEIVTAACVLTACQACEPSQKAHRISAERAKKTLEENPHAVLLDVRTEAEFKAKRIPGAISLPDDELDESAQGLLPDKEALILIYCRSGMRSAKAARELTAMGYTNVYEFGGIRNWPYATEGD